MQWCDVARDLCLHLSERCGLVGVLHCLWLLVVSVLVRLARYPGYPISIVLTEWAIRAVKFARSERLGAAECDIS